jgi:hypothetical protein
MMNKNRSNRKMIGVLCLVLVLALSATGAAYAGWIQGISMTGDTQTGWYNVTFDSFTPPESGVNQTAFTATMIDEHNYNISMVNLYPGFDAVFTFVLKNSGTIPAKITAIKINNDTTNPLSLDLNENGEKDITVTLEDISTSTTLAPGAGVTGHLRVHTWKSGPGGDANDAAASASGNFTLEIDTEQSS